MFLATPGPKNFQAIFFKSTADAKLSKRRVYDIVTFQSISLHVLEALPDFPTLSLNSVVPTLCAFCLNGNQIGYKSSVNHLYIPFC